LAFIDSSVNIIWQHLFCEPNKIMFVYSMQPLRKGNIILCASVNHDIAFARQLTPTGQVLWQRYYKSNDNSTFNVLVACDQTPNGDLIFTGSALNDSTPAVQGAWLMWIAMAA
jgi:hypothetical protein